MISSKDYIVRQINQLVQALSTVLGRRGSATEAEIERILSDSIESATEYDLSRLRQAGRDDVMAICSPNSAFRAELAVTLADLLALDSDRRSRERAIWLYEAAAQSGGVLPHDITERIEALRLRLH
jgi:hypothetical protein